jgi:hypothetical protein
MKLHYHPRGRSASPSISKVEPDALIGARPVLCGGAPYWASLVRCECPANDHFCRMARKAVSLRRPFGDLARAVDPAPLFQAPLFRPDGILGRVRAQILCTRLIDAEPSLRGSGGKALK